MYAIAKYSGTKTTEIANLVYTSESYGIKRIVLLYKMKRERC